MNQVESFSKLRSVAEFSTSLRFELFYSLLVLTDPEARIHRDWKARSTSILGESFFKRFERLGGAPQIWPGISTLLPVERYKLGFEEVISGLQKLDVRLWQRKLLAASLHYEELVDSVLINKSSLKSAINRAPKKKQEWLGFLGLFPYHAENPLIRTFECLIAEPDNFKKEIIKLLRNYWESVFENTWQFYSAALQRSAAQRELLFASCSFEEFSRAALLRVELDSKKNVIKAVRGGYQIHEDQIDKCLFAPSAFNDKRLWSALKSSKSSVEDFVFFPYFDPSIQLDLALATDIGKIRRPETDPLLVFKALGDTTRFAIASLIARNPCTATELSQTLDVSKPTISHHLEVLRSAGLLEEEPLAGSIRLTLNRQSIEEIGQSAAVKLFESGEKVNLSLTRQRGAR
jgi:DNA-binding transcriptional ArsR family regulator